MITYQIRNVNNKGHGSFYYVVLPEEATDEEICNTIAVELTERKRRHESVLFIGWSPLFTERKMKVVEYDRNTHRARRGGRKGYAYLSSVKLKGMNIITRECVNDVISSFRVCLERKDERIK